MGIDSSYLISLMEIKEIDMFRTPIVPGTHEVLNKHLLYDEQHLPPGIAELL